MGRKAFISRHIVLCTSQSYRSNKPLYGIILILDEIIQDVVIIDDEIPVQSILEKYND